jgi:hypothetical protein
MFAFAVFWLVTKYKNKYIDPPPPPAMPTTTAAPANATEAASTPTTSTHVSSTTTSEYTTTESYNYLLKVPVVFPEDFDQYTHTAADKYSFIYPGLEASTKKAGLKRSTPGYGSRRRQQPVYSFEIGPATAATGRVESFGNI